MSEEAATLLLRAQAHGQPLDALPDSLRPEDEAAAYAIQRAFMVGLGEIGGWKVGAAGPDAAINCAPMPAAWLSEAPATLSSAVFRQREVESEIAFLFGENLPPRDMPYTHAEVRRAILSCHPAIEVLQSRFADPAGVGALTVLADLIQHGAFVRGAAIEGWEAIDFAALRVVQSVEGEAREAVGNPAGDMMRLMLFLANAGARWAGGIKAGQVVTCGSWTGKTRAGEAASVTTQFAGAAPVRLRFVN